jgi:hypothetical protein
MRSLPSLLLLVLSLALLAIGCEAPPSDDDDATDDDDSGRDDDDSVSDDDDSEGMTEYLFGSRFDEEESSVSNSGQIFRQTLIGEMREYLSDLTGEIDSGDSMPIAGDTESALLFYFDFDSSVAGQLSLSGAGEETIQQVFDDISSSKNLRAKTAGQDSVTDHLDWSLEFVGWDGAVSPVALLESWFAQLDALASDRVNGTIPMDPSGKPISKVFLTAAGQDLQQLIQKFLLGAVAFSQGTDDYLDDDVEGKGLLAPNVRDGEKPYTKLEHAWDEAFGYFGAARNYAVYTDIEIADGTFIDWDDDGLIDLLTEKNYGHSVNAGKRDRGASSKAPTDFTGDAWAAFTAGRTLIGAATGETLNAAEFLTLQGHRDAAVAAWEKAIAATVVHYINEVLTDMGAADYDFSGHAKHWSELKGFALSFQFNPRSPLSPAEFAAFHALVGNAPVLADAPSVERSAYAADLLSARDLLRDAYGFAPRNMGDSEGQGGW